MFASLKKHFNNFVAKASHTAHEFGESLSTRIGESLRNSQRSEDASLDHRMLREKYGVDGKNARNMLELIFQTSRDLKSTVERTVELDPVTKASKTFQAPKIRRVNGGSHDEVLMMTLESGDMVKIEAQGGKISIAMRSLDNNPKSQISRLLTKSEFAALYASIQDSLGGNDANIRKIIQCGAASSNPNEILGMPDTMHPHTAEILNGNSLALQVERRQRIESKRLGIAA